MEKKFRLLFLLALLMTAATGAWAEEQVVYTLDGTKTASNTAYATAGVVEQGGMTWSVTGNVYQNPWRIGGKSLSGVDRSVWSESSLDETVTKVTLEFGTADNITVNSITMMVAGDADFNNVIDTKAVTFSANNTVDVTPTEGKEWKNAYYLFVFNVTVSGSSNKFLQLKSIKFYNDPDAQQQGGGTEPVAGTYTVTMKDGVKDADKWMVKVGEGEAQALPIGGLKGDGSETVTLQYTGRLKVKSVKAVKEAAKPDLLPAVFTVDAGKTVKFSKGNLQATYNGSSWIWGFAEHQWDYIGNAAGNTSINGNGTVSANGTVDLFGWVGASSTWTGAAQYGISNSTATNNVDGYGNVGGEAQKVGWGATVGAGWRTLTKNEWLYLLSERATGVTVNSTDNARYTQATINTDGTAVKGLIIFPDSYVGGSPSGVTWGTINAKSTFETTCTSAGWTALEAAGCVFLPAAGYRQASNVTDAGIGGGYWSSSSSTAPYAFALYFESDYMTIQYGGSRKYGFSVRLVRDAN